MGEVKPISVNTQGFRGLMGLLRRTLKGRLTSFQGRRNYQEIFGWDELITAENMLYMYNRGGIAKRVVDAFPDAIWARPPQVWAEGDAVWTAAWDNLVNGDPKFWANLHRLDKLSRLGHYAVMLLGTDKPALGKPLTVASQLTYMQPYGQTAANIIEWDKNPMSPTFGRPIRYRIYPDGGLVLSNSTGIESAGGARASFEVHASRVLHVSRGGLEDDVFGQPSMAPIWDYLVDLRKVVGSSSESYWIAANRGLQADVDKDMALAAEDQAALEMEVDEFFNGFRRFIRTKGVEINELKNDIANPTASFDVLVTLISGTTGIPKRILLGSEAGQLASTQDKGNWAERVEEDTALHIGPNIIMPFIQKMIAIGLLPRPQGKLVMLHPDAYRMSPLERGQTQAQTARSIANIVKMLESRESRARNLLTDVEVRAILGFASDNRVLEDNPDP